MCFQGFFFNCWLFLQDSILRGFMWAACLCKYNKLLCHLCLFKCLRNSFYEASLLKMEGRISSWRLSRIRLSVTFKLTISLKSVEDHFDLHSALVQYWFNSSSVRLLNEMFHSERIEQKFSDCQTNAPDITTAIRLHVEYQKRRSKLIFCSTVRQKQRNTQE